MQKKELIVVLILAALVGLAATLRLFSTPLTMSADRAKPTHPRPPLPSQPSRDTEGPQAVTPLWPRLTADMLPRSPGARRLFEAAEAIAAEGLLDPAIATYRHFVQHFPSEAAAEIAALRIAQCFTLSKRYKEAAEQYELFLRRYPASALRPMALLWSGDSLLRIGQPDLARPRLDEVVTRYSTSPFAEGAKALLASLDRAPAPPKGKAP